ncbi:MAG TPA: hypothetical protein VJP02_29445, partial [Candidatus Sulfotelmatobacter sp.]|nr:hypothetical protein [Candidatus Sulfotelmatobacter sp.]
NYPSRCQHLKTNGTQCGSPAQRRNRFCYFHKRYQDERIRLNVDRRRRGTATFFLPVLEDANSIQMSLMQIMRLLLTGQIEHKIASLLLYALQTASTNLRMTRFDPRVHEVILDPRNAAESPLDESHLWDDEDFEEEEEVELDEVEAEIERKVEEAAEKARHVARWEARREIEARERARKRYEDEEKAKLWVAQHPDHRLVRRDGQLIIERLPKEDAPPQEAAHPKSSAPEPGTPESAATVRAQINEMIRQAAPELTKAYDEGVKEKAEQPSKKKPPESETIATESEKKAR